jgi:peptidase YpeB-like protein
MTANRRKWLAQTAIALAVAGAVTMAARSSAADEPLTGATLEQATAAALKHVGGGTVLETEAGDGDAAYVVEIQRKDGSTVEVQLDEAFKVIGDTGDDDEQGETEQEDEQNGEDDADEKTEGGLDGMIPQPDVGDLKVAPASQRVDLAMPIFSKPTNVTNPLFPVSRQESVLLVGEVDGQPFRTEVTLLSNTRIIKWEGQLVETLVSQYVAYLGGRIHEVAYDHYAQADDGSVWYFGEDVLNFKDGAIVDRQGTWFAGKDGPAAMIMPTKPKAGDVFRSENIPGLVFEEVTVKDVHQTLDGPLGLIQGGLLAEELHMIDNNVEEKFFAPGYGEFFTGGDGDVEALALAVPTDKGSGAEPAALATLQQGATSIFDAAKAGEWPAVSGSVETIGEAWKEYRADPVPKLIEPRMTAAIDALAAAAGAKDPQATRQAAIDTAQWTLDLSLRYRRPVEVDLARFDLWTAQLLLDADASDLDGMNGDFFTLDLIRDRIAHALNDADRSRINLQLEDLLSAVGDEDFSGAAASAEQLRAIVADVKIAD